jgi:hypothetical protein
MHGTCNIVDPSYLLRISRVVASPQCPVSRMSLKDAQDSLVGELLRATVHELRAQMVVALVGPYWWPAGADIAFSTLTERSRPLQRAGVVDGRTWLVGWHPGGASRRGFGPRRYAEMLIETLGSIPGHIGSPDAQLHSRR